MMRNRCTRAWAGLWLGLLLSGSVRASEASVEPATPAVIPPEVKPVQQNRPRVFFKPAPESVAELQQIEDRVRSVSRRVSESVVALRIGRAQGTGVVISEDGYVLTAAHVAGSPGRKVTVTFPDGQEAKGETLGINRSLDAGLLKITTAGDWPFADLGDATKVEPGDWCLALGHPNGLQQNRPPVVRLGRILMSQRKLMQSDCPLVGGDSGGPLFDVDGRVIAIHSRIGREIERNFHVPVTAWLRSWDQMVAGEAWGRLPGLAGAVLGVDGEDVPDGCRLTRIPEGYPAATAGLEIGDVVLALDDEPIGSFAELAGQVALREPGEEIELKIRRGERILRKTVVLAERSE